MDHKLLEILVCPVCKGRLQWNAARTGLVCRGDKLIFPVKDGIPVMLADKALPLDEESTSTQS